jgi:amidohydrolase
MPPDPIELDRALDALRAELSLLALKIHDNPELRFEERKAAGWVADAVEALAHVPVERGVAGMETALRARVGSEHGPRIAVLAEYDALPEIGHACGHNLIAAAAVGAFAAVARSGSFHGRLELIGTPAEEGGGGKIRLIEAGVFDGIDAAMMFHPFDRDLLAHPFLASAWLDVSFTGQPAHAAAAPWAGKSALTACLQTFNLVDAQRIHFRDGVRVHGFVTDGGQAVNVIVEHAACQFSVRAPRMEELERVRDIVERSARGAALACGVDVRIETRMGYRDLRSNLALARRFGEALTDLGRRPRETDPSVGTGSTDMGDVSHRVPAIHPMLAICDEGETMFHERPFAACAKSERGLDTMIVAAKAMARTAVALTLDPDLLAQVRREFESAAE